MKTVESKKTGPALLSLLATLALAASSCEENRGDSNGPGSDPLEDSAVFTLLRNPNPLDVESAGDPLRVLARHCRETGGRFEPDLLSCDCGPQRIFQGSRTGKGSCEPVSPFSVVGIDVPQETLGLSGGNFNGVIQEPSPGNSPLSAENLRLLVLGTVSSNFFEGYSFQNAQSVYLASSERKDLLFSRLDSHPELSASGEVPEEVRLLAIEALAWLEQNRFNVLSPVHSLASGGCAISCHQEKHGVLTGGRTIRLRRQISAGGSALYRASIFDADQRLNLILKLTPLGKLSYAVRNLRTSREESDFTPPKVEVLGGTLRSLGSVELDESQVTTPLLTRRQHSREALGISKPQAAICETGILGELHPERKVSYALGPDHETTFFGWSSLKTSRWDSLRDSDAETGILTSYESWLRGRSAGDLVNHAAKVIRAAEGESGPQGLVVLPIELNTCADNATDRWVDNLLQHSKARVVNLSFSYEGVTAQIEQTPLFARIRATEASVLWVAAAGNDGMNLDRKSELFLPQSLVGLRNLIKVGQGSAERGLSPSSNHGPLSVDLVTPSLMGEGTSFSAPRVTGLAAQIQHLHPTLSPSEVRKAILFSVSWGSRLLPVSSGGEMDPTRALQMAARRSAQPGMTDLEWIQETFCPDSAPSGCAEASRRIRYWQRTQLLPLTRTGSASRPH
jgi:hypothetical protein